MPRYWKYITNLFTYLLTQHPYLILHMALLIFINERLSSASVDPQIPKMLHFLRLTEQLLQISLSADIWPRPGKHSPELPCSLVIENISAGPVAPLTVKLFCQFLSKGDEFCNEDITLTQWIQGQTLRRVQQDINTHINRQEKSRVESTERSKTQLETVLLPVTCGWALMLT